MRNGFASIVQRIKRGDLSWSGLLPKEDVESACAAVEYKSQASVYTPITTILTFLAQLLGADGSCQDALDGLIAEQVAQGKKPCSADTGGYCRARSRLPEQVYWQLVGQTGRKVEDQSEKSWWWQGHRVHVIDGSTLQIADTADNLKEYPLQKNLEPGLHYPVVRILIIFSLAVGTVLDAAIRPYQGKGTGETAMLRALAGNFQPGDVLLVDRCFAGYFDLAFWKERGIHVIVRNSASRKSDFRYGTRLGKNDHLVTWKKTDRPAWLDKEQAARVPDTLELREVRVVVSVPGFRTKTLFLITTLSDATIYTVQQLADLYRRRWQAELQFRSLKTQMGMKQLRCKTPEMLRKEFALYLVAYNCIRLVGAEAARDQGLEPYQISFTHTKQSINAFFPRLHQTADRFQWVEQLLHTIAAVIVANRPNRIEPYSCKTRPQEFPHPKETRAQYKSRIKRTH